MATITDLPLELVKLILVRTNSPASDLANLALVSRHFSTAAHSLIHSAPTLTSSTQLNNYLAALQTPTRARSNSSRSGSPIPPTRLTLARGTRTHPPARASAKAKAKKPAPAPVEDAITEDDLLRVLSAVGGGLDELRWDRLGFATLRRRQLGFVGQLAGLTTFAVIGRPTAPFHLSTLGQILTATPNLSTLSLSHIATHPSALTSLPPPTFRLTSITLLRTPGLTRAHLKWLLRPSSFAESLRHLALEWDGRAGDALNGVRYAALRVAALEVTTATAGLVEGLAMHFPRLERLVVRAGCRVEAGRLFGNLEWPLRELVDCSGGGRGVGKAGLGWVVASGEWEFARGLRSVQVGEGQGVGLLRVACEARRVQFSVQSG